MRIEYDPEADAAYIYLTDEIGIGGVHQSVPVDPIETQGMFVLDFDDDRRLIGIEVLAARTRLHPDALSSAERNG